MSVAQEGFLLRMNGLTSLDAWRHLATRKESMCDLRIFFHVSERKIQEAAVGG